MSDARTPVIAAAIRSPIGRYRGSLSSVRPDDLAAALIAELHRRHPEVTDHVRDVYLGATNQAGEDNRNVARTASLLAGLPNEIPGVTINRLCGSGLEAVIWAAKSIMVGEGEVYLAGGVESMTRAPYVMPRGTTPFADKPEIYSTSLGWRMTNPRLSERFPIENMGETAENVAERYGVSREDQDAWALRSHQHAAAAQDAGHFSSEIVGIELPATRKQPARLVNTDEGIRRDTDLEKLARLRPAFREGGSVTAGNSSSLNDGAAMLLLTSLASARRFGLRPLARILSWGHAGVDPRVMGIGPVPASQQALVRAELESAELDRVELNEAFASQVVASLRELKLDPERVNPSGGAIALGHPLGCSGARIMTTLVHGLHRDGGRLGLATMCIGIGQGIACIIERL